MGPCYSYSGLQHYVVGRIPAELALTGPAGVSPGTPATITGTVTPQWVGRNRLGIPFIVQRWRWMPAGVAPTFTPPAPTINPSNCTPPAEDTNPALCTLTPTMSGRLEVDAIVNGVPETLRKNIGAVKGARICSAPPLKGFWYVTTQYSQIDAAHPDRAHTGRDQAGPGIRGEPVYAAEAGTVGWMQNTGDAGNTVIIDSGVSGGNSYYQHLNSFAPGLALHHQVAAGDLIGYVGSTGRSVCSPNNPTCDPAHLHFQQHIPGGEPYYSSIDGKPPKERRVEPCFF